MHRLILAEKSRSAERCPDPPRRHNRNSDSGSYLSEAPLGSISGLHPEDAQDRSIGGMDLLDRAFGLFLHEGSHYMKPCIRRIVRIEQGYSASLEVKGFC